MPKAVTGVMSPLDAWKLEMERLKLAPKILLCGAKKWPGSCNTDHRAHCKKAKWVTTDISAGPEVDLVHDLQSMWLECKEQFDGIFCPAVLEHIERPWTAVHSMAQLLRPGGCLYIQTHQTFPLHGYPNDYFRFSEQALRVMCFDSGLNVVQAGYESPCTITPADCRVWNPLAEAFLNVTICAKRP